MGSFLERAIAWGQGHRRHKETLRAMGRILEYGKCLSEQKRGDAENRRERKTVILHRQGRWDPGVRQDRSISEGRRERWGQSGGMEGGKDEGGRQASSFSQKEEDSMSIRYLRFKPATIGTEEEVPLHKQINKLNLAYENRITNVYTLKWLNLKLI